MENNLYYSNKRDLFVHINIMVQKGSPFCGLAKVCFLASGRGRAEVFQKFDFRGKYAKFLPRMTVP